MSVPVYCKTKNDTIEKHTLQMVQCGVMFMLEQMVFQQI